MKEISETVKWTFKFLIAFTLIAFVAIPYFVEFPFEIGVLFGQAAAYTFLLSQIPGIIRRFQLKGWFKKIQVVLQSSRAQIGILMFLLAFTHYYFTTLLTFFTQGFAPNLLLFQVFGFWALIFSFVLFITSNNQSKRLLKKWWQKLHRLAYVVLWLIFTHVLLISLSYGEIELIAIAIALVGLAQIASLIYATLKK